MVKGNVCYRVLKKNNDDFDNLDDFFRIYSTVFLMQHLSINDGELAIQIGASVQ